MKGPKNEIQEEAKKQSPIKFIYSYSTFLILTSHLLPSSASKVINFEALTNLSSVN